jgi:hypothetical protein
MVWLGEAPDWVSGSKTGHLNVAMAMPQIRRLAERGQSWALGQMYGVVGPGLIFARHLFRGLRRDMYVQDDKNAAAKKLVATWARERDAELIGPKSDMTLRHVAAPANRVFAVYISVNEMVTDFPDVYGWADHWAWIAADPILPGAPIDWNSRYDERLWSREGA